jgi:hypothetical protein
MKTITAIIASIALAATPLKAQELTGKVSAAVGSKYLSNGFSFCDEPTFYLTAEGSAKSGNTTATLTGIHTRNIYNQFNGKTSWIEGTLMADITHNFGPISASIGAYHTALPTDVFGIRGGQGAYAAIATDATTPSIRFYVERGGLNIGGWLYKAELKKEIQIGNIPATFELQAVKVDDYFIKKHGMNSFQGSISAPILKFDEASELTGTAKYQQGIGKDAITGFEGKINYSFNF